MAQQATTKLEETAQAADAAAHGGPRWFQAYVFRDRSQTAALAARAVRCGCDALVVTVDSPVLGRRERDQRNRFALRKGLELSNVSSSAAAAKGSAGGGAQAALAKRIGGRDPDLVWESIPELAKLTIILRLAVLDQLSETLPHHVLGVPDAELRAHIGQTHAHLRVGSAHTSHAALAPATDLPFGNRKFENFHIVPTFN